jgi:predicted RNA binding protein YcfA (HicA-like mRNA interferase family)
VTERLPRITAAEVIRALERAGFSLVRQSGSHKIYKNREGKRVKAGKGDRLLFKSHGSIQLV